jgi:flagellin
MGLRINTNVAAISAQGNLKKVTNQETSLVQKLSSGERITKSADDAAGLAISEKLKANIRSSQQANRNANDGISMIQVAEGGLAETGNMLIRMRELAIQAASDTIGETERSYTDMEFQQLKKEMNRIAETTEFNGNSLLNGQGESLEFQIGSGADEFKDRIVYDSGKINASLDNLAVDGEEIASKEGAQNSLDVIDQAIDSLSGQRAELGALQNRLEATSRNLDTYTENMSAANSRIRDVDYAEVTAKNASNNILKSAGTSVLGQANANPQAALRLIG